MSIENPASPNESPIQATNPSTDSSTQANGNGTISAQENSCPNWPASISADNEAEEEAVEILLEYFKDGRPQLARDFYEALVPGLMPSKTVICPVTLRMGIRKVKRRSGWWWVPPGAKEPTLGATAEDPWAEAPPKKKRSA